MAYDEELALRLRDIYAEVDGVVEKQMFGGIAFLVNGHMTCGITNEDLMVRVGPDLYEDALARHNVREMDFTRTPLRGFVYVAPEGFKTREALKSWVDQSLEFVATLPPKNGR